ncbi:MAG: hypothetical protein GTN73_03275 [Candidatus Aminicenantes bacterium]|nr:hypothetical protein [Candidatus Aminicenantes bacterium]
MKPKEKVLLSLALLFILHSSFWGRNFAVSFTQNQIHQTNQQRLAEILKRTKKYCQRLQDVALNFVCLEEIKEETNYSRDIVLKILSTPTVIGRGQVRSSSFIKTPRTKVENKYVYDFQLIRKGQKIMEKRILIEENGKKKNEKDAQLKTISFRYAKILFGPAGLLNDYWQHFHDYRMVGEEVLNGEKMLVIEAIPKASAKQKYLVGRIWVKESDSSIMKIEYSQRSIGNFKIIEERAKKYKAEPRLTVISVFGIEKNGIRFPSQFYLEESYVSKRGRKFIRTITQVSYKNYKFFTVETKIKFDL